ncbi:MAG: glycine cleavage system protein H [Eubacteriales bacterium]
MDNIKEYLYSVYHLWLKELDDSKFIIGITDYITEEMGDINKINLTRIGAKLMEGDIFGTVENNEEVYDLAMPLDGEIIDVNPKIEKELSKIMDNPLNTWLIKIKLAKEDQIYDLLNEIEYINFTI